MTKSPQIINLNASHLADERHAALQNAGVASHTARSAPCLASRLQAVNRPSYFFTAPKRRGAETPRKSEEAVSGEW